jgi:hypothetical protein
MKPETSTPLIMRLSVPSWWPDVYPVEDSNEYIAHAVKHIALATHSDTYPVPVVQIEDQPGYFIELKCPKGCVTYHQRVSDAHEAFNLMYVLNELSDRVTFMLDPYTVSLLTER